MLIVAVMVTPMVVSPSTFSDGSSVERAGMDVNVDEIFDDSIMVLDVANVNLMTDSLKESLSLKVSEGKPLLVNGDIDTLALPGIPQTSGNSPDASGVYRNDELNVTCMFSASGMNSMDNAEEWAANIASEVESRAYGGDSDFFWFDDVVENENVKFYVRTDFTKQGVVANETYYLIHHYLNPIIKNTSYSRETADVTVQGDMSNYAFSRLLSTSPADSAVPDITGSYEVGISFGIGGPSVSASHTWNYVSQYSFVDNDTDLENGTYTIFTDFNEEEFEIDDNMMLEPGAGVAVLNTSTLNMDFTFEMLVSQKYADKFWPWDPEWEYKTLEITKNVSINP